MGYREHVPEARLRGLIAGLWAFPSTDHAHRVLPDGCMDIVVTRGRAELVGTMQRALVVPASPAPVIGVRFRPGEAARLFSGLAADITDSEALLREVWPDDGARLENALLELLETSSARDADTLIAGAQPIVERALRQRLAARASAVDLPIRAAAQLLGDGVSVGEVAARVGVSERHLGRRFRERVGLSPRTFARVRRLQRAALELARGAKPAVAAALVGYADQPHFTREASALAGVSPLVLSRELCDGRDTAIPVML